MDNPHRTRNGQVPPNTRILGGLMGEVLVWAARQVGSECATVHQAVTLLETMAGAYAGEAERPGR